MPKPANADSYSFWETYDLAEGTFFYKFGTLVFFLKYCFV
jgi:hypothetical protein